MIFDFKGRSSMGITFLIIWITGIILLVFSGTHLASDMNSQAEVETEIQFETLQNDTLYISIDKEYYTNLELDDHMGENIEVQFYANEEYFYVPPKVNVNYINASENGYISIKKKSRARNYRRAQYKADRIYFPYKIQNDTLIIAPLIQVPKVDKWRNPKVLVTLYIPKGKIVKYVEHITDDPVLNDLQEEYHYKFQLPKTEKTLIIEGDSTKVIIRTEKEYDIDSSGI